MLFVESGCIRSKWLSSGIAVVFRQGGCIWAKVVVFGQKWLFSLKSRCIRANWLYSVKRGCIRAKMVVFGQKWLYSGRSGCTRKKLVVSGEK